MGAHHFKLDFVPIGARVVRDEDGARVNWLLVEHSIPEAVAAKLRTLLPKTNHWGECEEFVSADDWASDIRIFSENAKIAEISFRYAPGRDSVTLLSEVVALAKQAGCDLLVSSTQEIVSADFETVFATLRRHRAFRFLSDPERAIKEASNEIDQRGG